MRLSSPRRFGLLLTTIALAATGCDRAPRVADAVLEASPLTDPIEEPRDAGACSATLVAKRVLRTPGCWVDEKVSARSAALTYACGGGAASARFGVPFEGTVSADGRVDVSATTTFRWDDGCTWQSHQRITGALSSATLAYTYEEASVAGTRCMPAHCVATADIAVR